MGSVHRQAVLDPSMTARFEHGGELVAGRQKIARPIATKRSMHLVFRAAEARGRLWLLLPQHVRCIQLLLHRYSQLYEVRIYEKANAGNHLHLLVKAKRREGLQNFMRVFAGQEGTQRSWGGGLLPAIGGPLPGHCLYILELYRGAERFLSLKAMWFKIGWRPRASFPTNVANHPEWFYELPY